MVLGRNWLNGKIGEKYNALLCGAGHIIRIILRRLRNLLSCFHLFPLLWKMFGEDIQEWHRKNLAFFA